MHSSHMWWERPAARRVLSMGRTDADRADLDLLPSVELHNLPEPAPPDERAGAAGDDHGKRTVEAPERPEIEVVEVGMRDDDRVEPPEQVGGHLGLASEMPDAGTQNRVGHDPCAFEVDDDGAVPQPGEPAQRFSLDREQPAGPGIIIPFG